MSSNLRVDRILPSIGTEVGVGTATGSVALYGDVNVAGTLTYEDVTNIDSVGVITARAGVNISGGNLQVGGTTVINSGRALYNLEEIKLADTKELVLGSGNDLKIQHSGSHSFISQEGVGALKIKGDDIRFEDAGGTEALRVDSAGNVGINETTPDSKIDIVYHTSENSATANLIHLRADPGASYVTRGLYVKIGRDGPYDNSAAHYDIVGSAGNSGFHAFEVQGDEKLRITSNGDVQARRSRSNTAGDVALSIQPSDSTIHYGFRIDSANNNLNLDRVGSGNLTTFRNDGLISAKALHVTDNLTPTSGRGVEIFEAGTGVGQIQSYNRNSNGWDELRIKGSELKLYAGTSNTLTLNLQSSQSTLYGTSDGILNLDTTDGRGSFIRFKENGSSKAWIGCSEGLGTGGNQDDLGLRATRDVIFRTGGGNSMRLTSAGYLQVASDGVISGDNENIFQQHQNTYNVLQIRAETSSYAAAGGGALAIGVIRSASSSFTFGGWYSGNNSSNFQDKKFNFRGDGNAYADGSWNGGGADYAEYFEWSDANTESEDRRGISVVLDGDKIREATTGEDPIGVISANPSVVGDADMEQWKNKYLRTEYGSFDLDENGEQKLNPDYNSDQEYVSRENRPEWDCVGLMGKLRIRKGQVTGSRWIKMRDVSANVEEWLVR